MSSDEMVGAGIIAVEKIKNKAVGGVIPLLRGQ